MSVFEVFTYYMDSGTVPRYETSELCSFPSVEVGNKIEILHVLPVQLLTSSGGEGNKGS